jgi:hypothetical protein
MTDETITEPELDEERFRRHWLEILDLMPLARARPPFHPEGWDGWKTRVRYAVMYIARHERDLTDPVTPGVAKKMLESVETSAKGLSVAIAALPGWHRDRLNLDPLLGELDRVRRECRRLVDAVEVRRAGGGRRGRLDRARKEYAAWVAADLLLSEGASICVPSVAHDSVWVRLTEILLKIATGREPGDVSRACQEAMKKMEREEEFPDRAARRQLHRAPLSKDEELAVERNKLAVDAFLRRERQALRKAR